jgi:hypothetical protein
MTLEQRVEKLEKQNKWLKRLGTLAIAVGAVVVLGGQAEGKEVRHLLGKSLAISDDAGELRVKLGVQDGTSRLELNDRHGRSRVFLHADLQGQTTLFLKDGTMKERVGISVSDLGPAMMTLWAKDGQGLVSAYVDLKGSKGFAIEDKGGTTRAVLEVTPSGSLRLELRDTNGKVLWKAPGE